MARPLKENIERYTGKKIRETRREAHEEEMGIKAIKEFRSMYDRDFRGSVDVEKAIIQDLIKLAKPDLPEEYPVQNIEYEAKIYFGANEQKSFFKYIELREKGRSKPKAYDAVTGWLNTLIEGLHEKNKRNPEVAAALDHIVAECEKVGKDGYGKYLDLTKDGYM